MRVIIAAGGTGGHFYPGLAVAKQLISTGQQVLFLIKKGDYVKPLLDRENIPYRAISAGGFKRKLDPKNILVVGKLLGGFFESFEILESFKPDAVLVMGGYLSVPPALAARCMGIPVVLHEQNVIPGLANRVLCRLVKKVAVSFPPSIPVFGGKSLLTGNPIREEFLQLPPAAEARQKFDLDPSKFTVFIFGGSLGAQKLNQYVVEAFESIVDLAERVQIIHITGPNDLTPVRSRYDKLPFQTYVDAYIHDMPTAYAACDLVICRAGASTVSELMVVKKPAILVPYPLATNDHQTANAQVLAEMGAGKIYEQKDLSQGQLNTVLREAVTHPETSRLMQAAYRTVTVDPATAAEKIAELIRKVNA